MIRIGTSGWTYDHWRERFYPHEIKKEQWLEYYARFFDTVEVNGSFYRLPSRETFEKWARQTPDDFLFSIKASRYITHVKRLKEPEEPIQRLFSMAEGLGGKLGPVLFQLPPRFPAEIDRLRYFLSKLPTGRRIVFEFRDISWFQEDVYQLLNQYDVALCIADSPEFPYVEEVTASFVYVRLHGHVQLYASEYSEEEIWEWGEKARGWESSGRDVFIYFDNDTAARAVVNAMQLQHHALRLSTQPT